MAFCYSVFDDVCFSLLLTILALTALEVSGLFTVRVKVNLELVLEMLLLISSHECLLLSTSKSPRYEYIIFKMILKWVHQKRATHLRDSFDNLSEDFTLSIYTN